MSSACNTSIDPGHWSRLFSTYLAMQHRAGPIFTVNTEYVVFNIFVKCSTRHGYIQTLTTQEQ